MANGSRGDGVDTVLARPARDRRHDGVVVADASRRLDAAAEQRTDDALATVLGKLLSGNFADLGLHRYDNRRHPATGAVLPPSEKGYLAVDVPNPALDRGGARLVIHQSTGQMYYTNNHYRSFYPIRLNPKPD